MDFNLIQRLHQPADTKIVLLVIDGLGGLPRGLGNTTELETARTPNLDDLAKHSICGLHQPIGPAATSGSGLGPRLPATDLMPLALANAGRLKKYGA